MSIEVSFARQMDIPSVLAIELASFTDPWTELSFQYALENGDMDFLVLRDGEEVFGFLLLQELGEEAEIYNVAVRPDFRGTGLGGKLLDEALAIAERKHIHKIYLDVRAGNEPAKRLYTSRGFVPVGVRKKYYSDPVEDAILMDRDL